MSLYGMTPFTPRGNSGVSSQNETIINARVTPEHDPSHLSGYRGDAQAHLPKGFAKRRLTIEDGDLLFSLSSNDNVSADAYQHFQGQYLKVFAQLNNLPDNVPFSFIGIAKQPSESSGDSDAIISCATSGLFKIVLRSGEGCEAGARLFARYPDLNASTRSSGVVVNSTILYPEIVVRQPISISNIFAREGKKRVDAILKKSNSPKDVIKISKKEIKACMDAYSGEKSDVKGVNGLTSGSEPTPDDFENRLKRDLHEVFLRSQTKYDDSLIKEFAWRKINAEAWISHWEKTATIPYGTSVVLRTATSVAFSSYENLLVRENLRLERLCFIGTAKEACSPEGRVLVDIGR